VRILYREVCILWDLKGSH